VGPGSRIRLARFDFDDATHKGSSQTQVEKGALAVVSGQIAHENPKGMTVQTPTSVLGVRGTRFVVTVK
ncbi:MAG: FecR domain-containing protein, partial [Sandarakinorhabdus sp.]|nr:FecR domain-containing protein [Sandarakinorhabdus sp.]